MPQGYTEAAAEITDTPGKKRKKKNKTKKKPSLPCLRHKDTMIRDGMIKKKL